MIMIILLKISYNNSNEIDNIAKKTNNNDIYDIAKK